MSKRKHRFQAPPSQDPLSGAKSSLAFRLNFGFFFRQLIIFLLMDLLLFFMATAGLFLYAENRCANVAALVEERGVPSADAIPWMEASDYTITPLGENSSFSEGGAAGYSLLPIPFLPQYPELEGGTRSWDLSSYYTIALPNDGEPYAITVDLSGISSTLYWAGVVLLVCEGLSLITGLFRNNRSIHKILKPIQDLAATTSRLNSMTHMSRQELEALAGELEKINAKHLDSRIDLPATQKELRSLAQAINAMLDRINKAYSAQMRFVSDASHELRTPIAVIQGYAALLDRWGKDDPEALQESINAIRSEAKSMENLVEQLLFLARGDNDTQPVKRTHFDLTALAGEVPAGGGDDPRGPPLPAPVGGGPGTGVRRPGAHQAGDADPDGQQREIQRNGQPGLPAGDGTGRPRPGHRPGRGHGHLPRGHPPHLRPLLPHRSVPGPEDRRHRPGPGHRQVDHRPPRGVVRGGLPGGSGHPDLLPAARRSGASGGGGGRLMYYVYLLRCGDGTLYAGYTNDLQRRLAVHNAGKRAKYTRSRLPVELVYWESFSNKSSALKREYAIKQCTRKEKLALIQTFTSRHPI